MKADKTQREKWNWLRKWKGGRRSLGSSRSSQKGTPPLGGDEVRERNSFTALQGNLTIGDKKGRKRKQREEKVKAIPLAVKSGTKQKGKGREKGFEKRPCSENRQGDLLKDHSERARKKL